MTGREISVLFFMLAAMCLGAYVEQVRRGDFPIEAGVLVGIILFVILMITALLTLGLSGKD